jgi:hypothetical protein
MRNAQRAARGAELKAGWLRFIIHHSPFIISSPFPSNVSPAPCSTLFNLLTRPRV